jgi:hypothetical protein
MRDFRPPLESAGQADRVAETVVEEQLPLAHLQAAAEQGAG